jgi:hypothetical protein
MDWTLPARYASNGVLQMQALYPLGGLEMAFPPCSFCGEYEAAIIMTSCADGDTVTPCGNCAPGFLLTMAASVAADMPPGEAAEHAEALTAIASLLPVTIEPTRPAGKRSARSAAKPEPVQPPPLEGGVQDPLLDECPNCGAMVEVGAQAQAYCSECATLFGPATIEA